MSETRSISKTLPRLAQEECKALSTENFAAVPRSTFDIANTSQKRR
jgi:hypothetical protein